jgi:hypothetical protein
VEGLVSLEGQGPFLWNPRGKEVFHCRQSRRKGVRDRMALPGRGRGGWLLCRGLMGEVREMVAPVRRSFKCHNELDLSSALQFSP